MPISQGDMDLKKQLETVQRLLDQGYLKKECAEEMDCSPTHITYLTKYQEAVDYTEQVIPALDRLLKIQNPKGNARQPHGKHFSFHTVCDLLGLGIEKSEDENWEDQVVAFNYGPNAQAAALEKALGKPLEDATDHDLLRVRYSDFKWHLEHP